MSTTSIAAPNVSSLRARLDRARAAAARQDIGALLITPGSDLRYLLGAGGASHERLTCLVLPADPAATPLLVLPRLEAPGYADVPTGELGVELATWVDGENPHRMVTDAAAKAGGAARVAVSDMTPALHTVALRELAPEVPQLLAGPVLRELRMRKDATEIEALHRAGAAIDRVHARVGEWLRPGRTEAEVGADIAAGIVAEGHTEAAFVIVGSGPNGASPHHDLSDRVIEPGDVVVVDIGGPFPDGYNSDSTRTYTVGAPAQSDVAETYAVLRAAQEAAVQAVRPGMTAEQVDAAARTVIADAGFGEFFVHRTGHGIGLDVHEEPYIVGGNALPLQEGMAFSVEPGIYLPRRWGARIEDIVVVTADGVQRLNNQPHDLVELPA